MATTTTTTTTKSLLLSLQRSTTSILHSLPLPSHLFTFLRLSPTSSFSSCSHLSSSFSRTSPTLPPLSPTLSHHYKQLSELSPTASHPLFRFYISSPPPYSVSFASSSSLHLKTNPSHPLSSPISSSSSQSSPDLQTLSPTRPPHSPASFPSCSGWVNPKTARSFPHITGDHFLNAIFSEASGLEFTYPLEPPPSTLSHDNNLSLLPSLLPSAHLLNVLNSKVYDVALETPLDYAAALSEDTNNIILLKREDLQPVFSFKIRGAHNKIASLGDAARSKGVVACSAGNHAQGVAYSARYLTCSAKIFMPESTPDNRVENIRRMGGEVILHGSNFDETMVGCLQCAKEEGRSLIHPFDDDLVMAGHGTIALEITKQIRSENVDAIFLCCGGGGLLGGVGGVLRALAPHVKIIGVESADAAGMTQSLRNGCVTELATIGTFADGASVKKIGKKTFDMCKSVVDEMIICSTDEICSAIKEGFANLRVVLEPAGALAIAGLKQYVKKYGVKRRTFIAVCGGANMDFDRLRFVTERADTSEHLLSVAVPEQPGNLKKLLGAIFPLDVTDISYRKASTTSHAQVLMSFRASSEGVQKVMDRLHLEGFEASDWQSNELAKLHGRHMAGGRSTGVRDELVYQCQFPETKSALKDFLEKLYNYNQHTNVTMWHYRNYGSDIGHVLFAVEVPHSKRPAFQKFLEKMKSLGYIYREETHNMFYKRFLKS